MTDPHLPAVAGRMECTNAEFERRCLVHLAEEQEKLLPDTALIALLCDAVRCVREYTETMQIQGDQPSMTGNWLHDLSSVSAYHIHRVIGNNIENYRQSTAQAIRVVIEKALERNKS